MSYDLFCKGTPMPFAPGVYHNVSRETYDRIPALSSTVIKKWIRLQTVPSVFKYWADHRHEEQPTEALILGQAMDCLRLENGLFHQKFVTVPPDAPKRPSSVQRNAKKPSPETIGAIAWWNKFNEESEGKQLLTTDQLETVRGMDQALLNASPLSGVFEHCEKVVLVGEVFGRPAKAEIDLWNENSGHILEIKTALDVTEYGFARAIDKYQYVEQATWYMRLAMNLGVVKHAFDWIAVGNEKPYPVKVHPFVPIEDKEHDVIYGATSNRLEAAVHSLSSACLTDKWEDDPDWHPIKFAPYTVAQARRELEG